MQAFKFPAEGIPQGFSLRLAEMVVFPAADMLLLKSCHQVEDFWE